MNAKEIVCRLCLRAAENDFDVINETMRQMLQVLLLKVNLDISKDPIICKDCVEIAVKCHNFLSVCTDTQEHKFPIAADKNTATSYLKDVIKAETDIENVDDNFICRFCSNYLNGSNFDSDNLINNVTIMEMLQSIRPEMDFDIKNSVMCTCCKQDIECYIKFVENTLEVEDKINKYIRNEGTPSSGQVKLSDINNFLLQNNLQLNYTQMHVIKQEENTLKYINEIQFEVYNCDLIKSEDDIDIKNEELSSSEAANEVPPDTSRTLITEKHSVHTLTHEDVTEMRTYKCTICPYETEYIDAFKNHMLSHKNNIKAELYMCPMCVFKTKHKNNLNGHMLVHFDKTEVDTYKCPLCTHRTKYKSSLKNHMLIHKDVAEIEMYKCSMCTYQAKQKANLKTHMLTHQCITDEVEMYKCSLCTFETKYKSSFLRHLKRRLDSQIIAENDKCKCGHKTKRKSCLMRHKCKS